MANPHKGDYAFEAAGAQFTLCYSANAICELEDALDTSIVALSQDLAQAAVHPEKARMSVIRTVFWAGLREHHPDVDVKAAGDLLMAAGGLMAGMNLISDAMGRAFPAPEMKGARPTRKARSRNGTG